MSTVNNPVYFWNFFEQSPIDYELFEAIWIRGGDVINKEKNFVSLRLHKSTDTQSKYPHVSFGLSEGFDIVIYGKPTKEWMAQLIEIRDNKLKTHAGPYTPVESYSGEELVHQKKDHPEILGIFLTAVKLDESVKETDVKANWKSWTGADLLHEKLGNNLVIDSHLYKAVIIPGSPFVPTFQYVVRTLVREIEDSVAHSISKQINDLPKPSGIDTETAFYYISCDAEKQ